MNRPLGVTIIAVLLIVGGILGILEALDLLGVWDLFGLDDNSGVGIGILIVAAANLLVGFGFWSLQGWAWTLAVIVTILRLVSAVVGLFIGGLAGGIIGLVIVLIILWYLFRPEVKAAFGK